LSSPTKKRAVKKATKRAALKAVKTVSRPKIKRQAGTTSTSARTRKRFRAPKASFIEIRLAAAMKLLGLPYISQYKVRRRIRGCYYLDFGFPDIKLAIECDGRDFHSTPTQIRNDLRRQGELEQLGWCVLRFTGSQINTSPRSCAQAIQNQIQRMSE
jgi:very-short-patch-repair endonuclease